MSQTRSELAWLAGIFEDLNLHVPTLFCDKKEAEYLAHNQAYHSRTKHLKLDCYYVRENVDAGFISTSHVKSTLQLADVLHLIEGRTEEEDSKLALCHVGWSL